MASLLLTLAGLFGMHGLGNHAANTHGSHATGSAAPAAAADVMAMPSMDAGLSDPSHAVADVAGGAVAAVTLPVMVEASAPWEPTGGGMLMGAAGMCMAVLLLSLIAMAVYLHASRSRPVAFLTARPTSAPATPGRDPDPPSLFVLSIQRC
ncbi:hypothetical protein EDD33_2716 [Nocardioides aurantiacus]|uniref:Uncharacterized protein n=1 Tax=Nocardioides aurantiacus TaxID=86796 RepID=A0A3N2CWH6_9ACTN|nr:hypothetical protein EDD33_2716 [Nocardioides aurantiacus]